MQLIDTKTRNEIIKLYQDYREKDRLADKVFIKNTLDILNQDRKPGEKIPYEVNSRLFAHRYSYKNGISNFNAGGIRNFASSFPEKYREHYDEAYDAMIANLFALYEILFRYITMMHRLGLTEDDELNRMYVALYDYLDNLPPRILEKYKRKNKWVTFERNARLAAFKELREMFTLSSINMIPTLEYLFYIKEVYEDGKRIPMQHDFARLGLDYNYDFSHLPFIDALENGVAENKEGVTKALELIDDAFSDRKDVGVVYYALRREDEGTCQK